MQVPRITDFLCHFVVSFPVKEISQLGHYCCFVNHFRRVDQTLMVPPEEVVVKVLQVLHRVPPGAVHNSGIEWDFVSVGHQVVAKVQCPETYAVCEELRLRLPICTFDVFVVNMLDHEVCVISEARVREPRCGDWKTCAATINNSAATVAKLAGLEPHAHCVQVIVGTT